MTQLTALRLTGSYMGFRAIGAHSHTIAGMPTSLQRLAVSSCSCMGGLRFRRLSALTELELDATLSTSDALPPSLVRLQCNVQNVQPLLGLSRLQHLGAAVHVAQLTELTASGVTQLTHVVLSLDAPGKGGGDDSVRAVLAPLACVLWDLRVRGNRPTQDSATHGPGLGTAVAPAPHLTRLAVGVRLDAAALEALPGALECLRELRELHLDGVFTSQDVASDAAGCLRLLRSRMCMLCPVVPTWLRVASSCA